MGGFSLPKCYKNFAVRLDKCQGDWNNRDKKGELKCTDYQTAQ